MKTYLTNSFSLNMVPSESWDRIRVEALIHPFDVLGATLPVNAIGHADTAAMVANLLAADGVEVPPAERRSISLERGDRAVVAQYVGPRLPEGSTTLPEGARIIWALVEVLP